MSLTVNNFKKNLQVHSYTSSQDIPDQGEHAYNLCNNRSKSLAQLFSLLNPEKVFKFKRKLQGVGYYIKYMKSTLLN
jgi:hypothetical protein